MYHYNYKFWLATTEELNDLILRSDALKKIKPTQDKTASHEIFAHLYARYVGLINNLSYLYDQTGQVQKRALILKLLQSSMKRLMELRNELKKIELSEFIYIDKVLIQRKFVIEDIQLVFPYYFPYQRDQEIQDIIDGKKVYEPPPTPHESETNILVVDGDGSNTQTSILDGDQNKSNSERKSIKTDAQKRSTNISLNQRQSIKTDSKTDQTKKQIPKFLLMQQQQQELENMKTTPQISPRRKALTDAVNLIKTHERARKARLLLTNIKLHPALFKPKPRENEFELIYDFTHKPEQAMLVQVRRTNYDVNYHVDIKELEEFDYYIRPEGRIAHIRHIKPSEDDAEETFEYEYEDEEYEFENEILEESEHEKLFEYDYEYETDIEYIEDDEFINEEGLMEDEYEQSVASTIHSKKRGRTFVRKRKITDVKRKIHREILKQHKKDDDIKSASSSSSSADVNDPSITDLFDIPLNHKLANRAAKKIQKHWKKYLLKKEGKKLFIQKQILYGMISKFKPKKDLINKRRRNETEIKYRNRKPWFDEQFLKVCEEENARLVRVKGPWIMEDISDHIRFWFQEFYDKAHDFHRYPEEWEGGTILLLRGETMTVEEFIEKKNKKKMSAEQKKKEAEKRKKEKEKQKELKKKLKEQALKKKREEAKKGPTYNFDQDENENFAVIKKTMINYDREWFYIDEENNTSEEPYRHWIIEDELVGIHQNLRLIVDNMMRIEFELLRKALAKQNKKKYKPQKQKKQKRKGGKKGKKKKNQKDLTADRSIESLFYELDQAGVIEKYPKRTFDEITGDYNYIAYELRNFFELDPSPSFAEVKDIFREWLLGFGPMNLPKPKSICIFGPKLSGKKFLADIIATEIDAVVFNLTPEIVLKYEKKLSYFIHLIAKMSRILQPTVIKIDQVHRVFWKKVPKDQQHLKPKLLGKHLFKKIIKPIKIDEKILILGLTDIPWQANFGKMKRCFEKALLLPKNDYASSFLLWRTITLSLFGMPRDFEFSPLVKVTKDYKCGEIAKNISITCGIRRRMRLSRKPLKHIEFIETFFQEVPPSFPMQDAEFRKYITFYTKINPLKKLRTKLMKQIEAKRNKEKAKKN